MKNKFVFVYRWDGDSGSDFWPFLKEKLHTVGEVVNLDMPNSEAPEIDAWVNYLKEHAGLIDENVHFVAHSVGCQTVMRFLESENIKVGNLYFVAPWFTLSNLEDDEAKVIAGPWLTEKIDLKKVVSNSDKIKVFLSKDDEFVPFKENKQKFVDLGADVYEFEDRGHFTEDDGCSEFPELLVEILTDVNK